MIKYDGVIGADASVLIARLANLETNSCGSRYQGEMCSETVNTWLSILSKAKKDEMDHAIKIRPGTNNIAGLRRGGRCCK